MTYAALSELGFLGKSHDNKLYWSKMAMRQRP